jgi:hypothetical protein
MHWVYNRLSNLSYPYRRTVLHLGMQAIYPLPSLTQFKGIVSRDEYFLKVLKSKQYLSCLFVKEIQIKFLLASMKSLTNCEIPSSDPPQKACSDLLIAACVSKSCYVNPPLILKIVQRAGYECTLEKIDQ